MAVKVGIPRRHLKQLGQVQRRRQVRAVEDSAVRVGEAVLANVGRVAVDGQDL